MSEPEGETMAVAAGRGWRRDVWPGIHWIQERGGQTDLAGVQGDRQDRLPETRGAANLPIHRFAAPSAVADQANGGCRTTNKALRVPLPVDDGLLEKAAAKPGAGRVGRGLFPEAVDERLVLAGVAEEDTQGLDWRLMR